MKTLYALIATLTLLALTPSATAQKRSVEEQRRIIENLERDIASGERQIASIRKDKSSKQVVVNRLYSQVMQRTLLIEEQRKQSNLINQDIKIADRAIAQLSEKLMSECKIYSTMARECYRNYKQNNYIHYLFASQDFNDITRRVVNIRHASELRLDRMRQIDSLAARLGNERAKLVSRKAELDSIMLGITHQKSGLERDISSARADIKTMNSKERQALENKELKERQLSTAIDAMRKLSKGNTSGATFTSQTSNLRLPVVGGKVKRYLDNMAEIVGAQGARVVSIYEGKVVDIKQNRISGNYDVYIAHGEYITSYAGLKSVAISKNAIVPRNQTIGEVGAAVNIATMNTEYKIIFGIYPPKASQKMKASDCFKK